MTVGLVLDPLFEDHDTGPGHPERPERLKSIREALKAAGLVDACSPVALEPAGDDLLSLVHDPAHIRRVEEACSGGERLIDAMDTAVCPESAAIARQAAGSLVSLSERVARGGLDRGLAVVRPPGHHAERDLAMGFCLFNNVAVAARNLIENAGCSRVLVVDWDVHHGNGTQHIFEDQGDVFFFSVHQSPLYPGTGARSEIGRGEGVGKTLNVPLPAGAGDGPFLDALRDELVPAAEAFRPDFVLISAGFDAHRADPLANLEVTTEAFAEATRIVRRLADNVADGKLVSVTEGGYDLFALAQSTTAHLRALLE